MCRFGVRMDLLARNPIEGLPPLPMGKAHEKNPRRPFADGERIALLDAAEQLDQERRARTAA